MGDHPVFVFVLFVAVCLILFRGNSSHEISAEVAEHIERGGNKLLGELSVKVTCFKAEVALVAYLAQTENNSVPVAAAEVGRDMVVAYAVVIVNVERFESVAELFYPGAGILTEQEKMSYIEAEAEASFARDDVKLVYIFYRFVDVGAASRVNLFGFPILHPHIFKAAYRVMLFEKRNDGCVVIHIELAFFFLREGGEARASVKEGVDNYAAAAKLAHKLDAFCNVVLQYLGSLGLAGNKERERSVHLTEFNAVFFCGGFVLRNEIVDASVFKKLAFFAVCQLIPFVKAVKAEVNGIKARCLDRGVACVDTYDLRRAHCLNAYFHK